MDPTNEPGIAVGQVFVETLVFSHREDFLALPPETQPAIGDVSVGMMVGENREGNAGVVRIQVKTDLARKPIYNIELVMIALVTRVEGAENMTIPEFLRSGASVSLLYPFLREAFANITLRGRFGPVYLGPINPQVFVETLTQLAAEPVSPGPTEAQEVPQALAKPRKRKRPSA